MEPKLELLSPARPLAGVSGLPHGLLEAPRAGADGSLIYSDVTGGGVYRVQGDGEPQTVVPKRRGVGGMLRHRDGGVVISGRSVLHVAADGERELLALDDVPGFNDMTADARGRVYVGSMRFRPFAGEPPAPSEIWRIDGPGDATVVAEGIKWPNGIAFSPDAKSLYASDTAAGELRIYRADQASEGEVWARAPRGTVDGLAVDEEGGVWVALGDGGIARFDSEANLTGVAELPVSFVSSLCFGGPDRRDVFITTADSPLEPDNGGTVLQARSEVAGLAVSDATV